MMTKAQRKAFVFTLLLGTFTMSISQSSLSTAYPTLMKFFNVDAPTIQWLTTGFMLIMCIMMPVSPWLLNNLSFKKMYLTVLAIFELGTLMIILAPNFPIALLGRGLEAVAVGILFPSYQSVLMTITAREGRAEVMGLAGLVMGSALACGPIISGIILNYISWQGLFWFFLLVIALIFVSAIFNMRDVMERKESQLDFISVIYSLSFIGLLYFVNELGTKQLTLPLYLILVVSVILFIAFILRQFRVKDPLLQLRVLKVANFDIGVLLTGFAYISLIVVTIVYPLYYQRILHVNPLVSGLALVPPAALLSILNLVSGRLADKVGFKITLLIGMVMLVVGWAILFIFSYHLNVLEMILIACIIEGGNAFVMMPATTMGANSLPENMIPHGTAITTTVRQLLGSLGVALAMIIIVAGGHTLSEIIGYHYAFGFFCILEIVGLILAIILRDDSKK
ncbi:MDR family MFS transporter [Ligilactobacillus salivarius]|uniref:MDR family MFS transporter n=1 Tax=Ligilactobacillus salivarius TaxID=1624 RepID=UPI0011C9A63B|nr:MDR family MFS transporter [Ligilactobacillus salivarius]MBX0283749.1 multidrug efflux MFS transporter [Ligilactobacillus salivarius]TXJ83064.1 multidrug efflux MFS transporter [Ligilactobacillus salivarius]